MANTVNYFTRKYLTSDEMAFIIKEMLKHDNTVEREIVKVGMVAQLVVKELGEYEDCNGVYDYVMEKGIDLTKIVNYEAIDRLYNEEVGINKTIKDFVDSFKSEISKSLEGLNLGDAIAQLKELSENHDKIVEMPKTELEEKYGRK